VFGCGALGASLAEANAPAFGRILKRWRGDVRNDRNTPWSSNIHGSLPSFPADTSGYERAVETRRWRLGGGVSSANAMAVLTMTCGLRMSVFSDFFCLCFWLPSCTLIKVVSRARAWSGWPLYAFTAKSCPSWCLYLQILACQCL
jgi:hypothetical protein